MINCGFARMAGQVHWIKLLSADNTGRYAGYTIDRYSLIRKGQFGK